MADFNPRSPHGERLVYTIIPLLRQPFQSTLPARGATDDDDRALRTAHRFQSTLPARGATSRLRNLLSKLNISIHAPRTGSDLQHCPSRIDSPISIHAPRTGSDGFARVLFRSPCQISIHAPRTGSDKHRLFVKSGHGDFNPRSPHGERQYRAITIKLIHKFQSTLPARGATRIVWRIFDLRTNFNPRSPHGERQGRRHYSPPALAISIHAPRTGSDI